MHEITDNSSHDCVWAHILSTMPRDGRSISATSLSILLIILFEHVNIIDNSILQAREHRPVCPLCRELLSGGRRPNVALMNLIRRQFPEAYLQRETDSGSEIIILKLITLILSVWSNLCS